MTEHHETNARKDPHVDWWLEFEQQRVEIENYELLTGREPTDDNDDYTGKMDRLNWLCDRILGTRPATFAGVRIQSKLLISEFDDPDSIAGQALAELRCFVLEVETVLASHGSLKADVERWLAERRPPQDAAAA